MQDHMTAFPKSEWKLRFYQSILLSSVCIMMLESRERLKMADLTISGIKNNDLRNPARGDENSEVEQHAYGFRTLIDEYRTLWTAGWNARYAKYYLPVPPKVTWALEAEDIVEREYRRLHFPAHCSDVNGKRGWNKGIYNNGKKIPYPSAFAPYRVAGCQCIQLGRYVGDAGLSI